MNEKLKLPAPNLNGPMSLERAISIRRSCRDFLPDPLTIEQTSQLCWAAQGQTGRYKTVPSAGATYPLELFVVSADGLLHYLPDHSLEKLSDDDLRPALCHAAWGQQFIADAAATFVLAAEFKRTTARYGPRGQRYVYAEAGHAAQNIHLQAEALGLGSVAVGAFDDAAVAAVLSLPAHLEPVYMVIVAHKRT